MYPPLKKDLSEGDRSVDADFKSECRYRCAYVRKQAVNMHPHTHYKKIKSQSITVHHITRSDGDWVGGDQNDVHWCAFICATRI